MTEKQVNKQNLESIVTGLSKKGYGYTLFAKRNFKPGELVCIGYGRFTERQSSHCSIQVDFTKHIVPKKLTGRYWNHSCHPNTYVKTRKDGLPSLIALRDIKKDEEITYAYWMTELKWGKKAEENYLSCLCGEKQCKGKILSFSQLDTKTQSKILRENHCSEYLYRSPTHN